MVNPLKYTKPLIELSGKLDFAIRHGNTQGAIDTIKNMRIKLNQIQKFVNEHEVS